MAKCNRKLKTGRKANQRGLKHPQSGSVWAGRDPQLMVKRSNRFSTSRVQSIGLEIHRRKRRMETTQDDGKLSCKPANFRWQSQRAAAKLTTRYGNGLQLHKGTTLPSESRTKC